MKKLFIILNVLLLSLTFDGCFEDQPEVKSCIFVDNVSEETYLQPIKIGETKVIAFEISNECKEDYTIIDYEISGDIENLKIEGLPKNTFISPKKTPFKVIIVPNIPGKKTIGFFITTNFKQFYVSIGIDVIY